MGDPNVELMRKFLNWLDAWKNKGLDDGKLTSGTHGALYQNNSGTLRGSQILL